VKKLFAVDFKRLLQNRAAIIIAAATPLIFVVLISIAVAPYFFADVRADNFSAAVWCEDDDPLTAAILNSLVESKSLGGLITTEFVDSEEEGLEAIRQGAAAYIHIPQDMQEVLQGGGNITISYYGNQNMPLEDALLFETLDSGVELVSHAQHSVNVLYYDLVDSGVDQAAAAAEFQETTFKFYASVLSRSALYEDTDLTSPLGGALPLEYYAASFLIIFVALGGMPIARITADDYNTGIVLRQLLSGNTPAKCFVSRWLAGSAFLFIEYAVLTAAFCVIAGGAMRFSGSVPILLLFGILLSVFVSIGMMLIGLFSKTSSFAVRVSFMSVLALSLLGGLIIPSAYMPALIRDVSYYTPFAAALKLGISGMFDGNTGGILLFIAIFIMYIAVMLPISIKSFQRRTD
jgi:ABC-2 type transport system permease protein